MEFLDKKFLITGASSGIGKSSAELLIQKGATVVLLGRSPKKLKSIFGNQNNKNILIYEFDLKNYVDLPKLIRKICKNIGKLDGIFHSAGNHSALGINGLNNSILETIFHSSIYSFLFLAKAISSRSVRNLNQCSLVSMSSVSAHRGSKGLSVYSASKAAIEGAARSLASELSEKNIRVNCIAAAGVKTNMHFNSIKSMSKIEMERYEKKHLFGLGEPLDIAHLVIFLLSNKSKWITGSVFTADGGYLNS